MNIPSSKSDNPYEVSRGLASSQTPLGANQHWPNKAKLWSRAAKRVKDKGVVINFKTGKYDGELSRMAKLTLSIAKGAIDAGVVSMAEQCLHTTKDILIDTYRDRDMKNISLDIRKQWGKK